MRSAGDPSARDAPAPCLLVTVDTEEDGAWDGFRATGNTVRNAAGLDRFQELCDRYNIRPTYLVDEPVVRDEFAAEKLGALHDADQCEIGAHLHPWCNDPKTEEISDHNSYLCNLPAELQREKLTHLTELIEKAFGHRPTSFRAGRYGLDHVGFAILADLGYVVDSSVIPFTDYSAQHGPDFSRAPHLPYYPGANELCETSERGDLLEVPVTVGFNRVDYSSASRLRNFAMRPLPRRLRMVGIFDRLGIVQRIKLSPEQTDAARMQRLIAVLCEQRAPCVVLMLHSSSLTVGTSPYARTEEMLDRLFERLDSVFSYCCERDMRSATLTEFAKQYRAASRTPSAPTVETANA